jgi:hypothetical protein
VNVRVGSRRVTTTGDVDEDTYKSEIEVEMRVDKSEKGWGWRGRRGVGEEE